MKAIITGSVRAAREDLLFRGEPNVHLWSDTTMRGVVDGAEVFIVSIDHLDKLYSVELSGYEMHLSAAGHKHFHKARELAQSRVRLPPKEELK